MTGYEWNWSQAELQYRRALALRPDYATAHQFYAQMLVCLGRHSEAAAHIEMARRADPISPAINSFLPCIYLASRRYGRALQEAQRAVDLEPHAPLAHWTLGRANLFSNQPEQAVRTLEHAVALVGPASMWTSQLSFARARAGDRSGAVALLSELVERSSREHVSPYDLAIAYAGIGESRLRAGSARSGIRAARNADYRPRRSGVRRHPLAAAIQASAPSPAPARRVCVGVIAFADMRATRSLRGGEGALVDPVSCGIVMRRWDAPASAGFFFPSRSHQLIESTAPGRSTLPGPACR